MKKILSFILCFMVRCMTIFACDDALLLAIHDYDENTLANNLSEDMATLDATIGYYDSLFCLICKKSQKTVAGFKKHVKKNHFVQPVPTDINYCPLCAIEEIKKMGIVERINAHELTRSFSYKNKGKLLKHYNEFQHTYLPNQIALQFLRETYKAKYTKNSQKKPYARK